MTPDRNDGESSLTGRSRVFLSYAAEDRPLTERIARALEECGWDVWWDRRVGPGQQFDESIAAALRSSGAVVVLWSRHSVASEWVREEALHGKNRGVLVPVSLDGTDPPLGFGLRQAVDLTGWTGAADWPEFTRLTNAIAALLASGSVSESRPTLRGSIDAHPRSAVRRWAVPVGVPLAILIGGTAIGALYWDLNHREHVEHFANVTRRWGFPEGVGPLTSAQVSRRSASVALIRHGHSNPVDELRLVDSEGNTPPQGLYMPPLTLVDLNPLPATADRFVTELGLTRMIFTRDASGRILEQSAFTRGGRRLYTLHFATPDLGEYKTDGLATRVRESGISYLRFSRVATGTNAGLDERVVYLDADGKPQPDERGEYGYRIVLNGQGLASEKIRLGPTLEDATNANGVLKEVITYDDRGNPLEGWTLDRDGTRTRNRIGTAGGKYTYDDAGNFASASYYDETGLPMALPDLGAAGRTFTYDDGGRLKNVTFFGPDRKLVLGKFGYARQTIEWVGPNRTLERFFGPDDTPLPIFGGAFEGIGTYDTRGLPIEIVYRDNNSRPTRLSNGCSTIRLAYDSAGNNTQVECLDEDAHPTLSVEGYSTRRSQFDDTGNEGTTSFFDVQGRPGLQGESYTAIRRTFNGLGKLVDESYVDAEGKPRRKRKGYAATTFSYDSRGNRISETFLDELGHPTKEVNGCGGARSKFDASGVEIQTSFIDTTGRPCRTNDGYASAEFHRDASGFLQRVVLRDEHGLPVRGVDGFAGWVAKRNAAGLTLETTFLDEQGRPTIARRLGTGLRRWTYDGAGRVLARSDHDTSGRPMNNAFGYSTIKYIYDEYGRELNRELFDPAGRPLETTVMVDKVVSGSVAADAGFQRADVILTYEGEVVRTSYQFIDTLEVFKGDRRREVRVARGTAVVSLEIPPGRLDGLVLQEAAKR